MTISGFRKRFETSLEALMLALMAALALVVIVGVGFRKAGAALVWYDEVASILLAWLTYYGASFAALKRAHIGFPKLVQSVRPSLRLALVIAREIVVVGFFILVAWAGWQVAGLPPGSLGYVNLLGTAMIVPASVLAAPLGVRVAHGISRRKLELAFAAFLALVAVRFLFSLLA